VRAVGGICRAAAPRKNAVILNEVEGSQVSSGRHTVTLRNPTLECFSALIMRFQRSGTNDRRGAETHGMHRAVAAREARRYGPRDPRPDWWIECCGDKVIVFVGTIKFTTTKADEIKVETSDEALKKLFGEQKLFYIGHLVIEKVLFAAPGVELSNGNVNAMISGKLQKAKILIPTHRIRIYPLEEPIVNDLDRGKVNQGVFIFLYDGSVSEVPLVFDQKIPSEGIKDVLNLFAYRKKFGHPPNPDRYFR
jgi:hypothetical protein